MSVTKRMVIVLGAALVFAAILPRAVLICFSVIWIFLWWGGIIHDNSPTPALAWLDWALYGAAVIVFAAGLFAGIRWARSAPGD